MYSLYTIQKSETLLTSPLNVSSLATSTFDQVLSLRTTASFSSSLSPFFSFCL